MTPESVSSGYAANRARAIPWLPEWAPGVIGAALSLLPVVITVIALVITIGRFNDSEARLRRVDSVLAAIATIDQKIFNVGIAERGYLLLGEPRYLAHYTRLRNELPLNLSTLREAVGSDPEQRRVLDDLSHAMNERVAIMDDVLAIGPGNLAAGISILKSSQPVHLSESILDGLAQVRRIEEERRAFRFEETDHLTATAVALATTAAVLGFVAAGVIGYLFRRQYRRHLAARARQAFNQEARLRAAREAISVSAQELARPLAIALNYLGTAGSPRPRAPGAEFTQTANVLQMAARQVECANDIMNRLRGLGGDVVRARVSVDLVRVIMEVVQQLDFAHPADVIDVDVPGDLPAVSIDPPRIQQVLINLLDDPTRTPERPDNRQMGISALVEDDRMVRVRIRDTGRVMTTEAAAEAFNPERSGGGPDQEIGLAICLNIVRAHGGEIWVESSTADGVVICFTVPIARESARSGPAGHRDPSRDSDA